MLKMISWGQFIESTLTLAGIYYLVIAALYFRSEMKALLTREKPQKKWPDNKLLPSFINGDSGNNASQEDLLTEKICSDLKQVIEKVIRDGVEREDLLKCIARVLEPHPSLKNSSYRIEINNFIIRECASMYSVHLDERELARLWGV